MLADAKSRGCAGPGDYPQAFVLAEACRVRGEGGVGLQRQAVGEGACFFLLRKLRFHPMGKLVYSDHF